MHLAESRDSGVAAAVAEADLVAESTSPVTRVWPFGQRVGGWVIHYPAVVCTSSSSTTRSIKPTIDCPANCSGVQQETSTRRER